MELRQATTEDAALLASVGSALFAQTFAAANTDDNLREYLTHAFGEEQQSRELADANNVFWIAEADNGEAIGYAHIKLDSRTHALQLERPAELSRIYADQRYHGVGVGQRLLAQCIDTAKAHGNTHLWLGVWEKNPRAIAFYKKHGFEVVGSQTFHVGTDPQTDLVMVRLL